MEILISNLVAALALVLTSLRRLLRVAKLDERRIVVYRSVAVGPGEFHRRLVRSSVHCAVESTS